jgi:hypothetical protein
MTHTIPTNAGHCAPGTVSASPLDARLGAGVTIVHPCDAFAQRAGYASWAMAVAAMQAGVIVTAAAPQIGRSMLDFNLFVKQIREDGLTALTASEPDLGFVAVGFRAYFPAEMLARAEREHAEFAAWIVG